MAWTDQMQVALGKLNKILPEEDKNMETKDLLIKYARNPETASIFNYASMLHNTHFFFEGLNSSGAPIQPTATLHAEVAKSFGSWEDLRQDFLTTANSMFGPGFVWLVRVMESSDVGITRQVFKILTTYLAGTPYAGAHYRQQPVDMNTEAVLEAATRKGLSALDFQRQHTAQNTVGRFGSAAQPQRHVSKGGIEVTPVLCVDMWEHAWLRQHGVGGKQRYLTNFWSNVDWHVVERRCNFRAEVAPP